MTAGWVGLLVAMALCCAPAHAAEAVDDTTAPAVAIAVPVDGAVLDEPLPALSGTAGTAAGDAATVTVELFAGDTIDDSPNGSAQVQATDGAWSAQSPLHLIDGLWTLRVRQQDGAGNTGVAAVSFWVDTQWPHVTVFEPYEHEVTEDTTPAFAGQATTADGDDGFVTAELFAGQPASGQPMHAWQLALGAGGAWSVTPDAALADGAYTLAVTQSDDAGHEFVREVPFGVDTTAPAPTITSPGEFARAVSVAGTGGTAAGDDVEVSLDLFDGPSATGTPRWSRLDSLTDGAWGIIPVPELPEGTYTLRVRQADWADRTGTALRTFVVDRTAPALTLETPGEGARVGGPRPLLSGTAGSAPGDADSVRVTIGRETYTFPVADGRWSGAPGKDLQVGRYSLSVSQSDAALNRTSIRRRTFYVIAAPAPPAPPRDTTGPTVELPARVTIRKRRILAPLTIGEFATGTVSLRFGRLYLARGTISGDGKLTVRMRPRRGALARLRRTRVRPTLHVRVTDSARNATSRWRTVGVRGR